MGQEIYVPGSKGAFNGYNLDASFAGKRGGNNQPLYPQWRNGGTLIQLDLIITNSMATSLNVELFNYYRSQTRMYSASNQANDYYPLGVDDSAGQPGATNGTYANPGLTFASSTVTNGYVYGIFKGAYNSFTDAAAPIVPTTTRNIVFFDIYGNQVYQPGYASAAIPTGNVIISCQQMPWIQLFEFSANNKLIIDCIKFTFNSAAQTSQMAQTVYHKYFSSVGVATNTENYTPSTFFNEGNFQSNIITVPVDKKMTPQWGIWYNVLGQQSNTTTQATLTTFMWVDNDVLKTNSSPLL